VTQLSPTSTTSTASNATIDLRRYGVAIVAATVLNLIVLAIGSAAGATLEINAPESINAPTVAAFTVGIMVIAGAALWALSRRRPSVLGWAPRAGLVFAVVTAVMPFLASPDRKTGVTLAAMHLITGLAWLIGLTRR
jgi:hypothetical protein